jgi:hypothetical protein
MRKIYKKHKLVTVWTIENQCKHWWIHPRLLGWLLDYK